MAIASIATPATALASFRALMVHRRFGWHEPCHIHNIDPPVNLPPMELGIAREIQSNFGIRTIGF